MRRGNSPAGSRMIKIDKGIPIPVSWHERSPYPWAEMKVGDSFAVPKGNRSINSSAAYAGRKLNRKFICRTVDEETVRVWRIK